MGFPGKVVGAVKVTGSYGCFGLFHELLNVVHHILLAGAELKSGDLFQVFLGRGGEFFGGVLLGILLSFGAACELLDRFARPSIANNFL
jgi:hypothetical protein